jgi:hypothetical protein
MHFDKELNTRGMSCPLPIVKTKKALRYGARADSQGHFDRLRLPEGHDNICRTNRQPAASH